MDQPAKFRYITPAEYDRLDLAQRQRYLQRSIAEVGRRLAAARDWQVRTERLINRLRGLSA